MVEQFLKKLESEGDIWKLEKTDSDWNDAIGYATVSLPWTFDRMQYGVSQDSVNKRLWHILIGVLNQNILERELSRRGHTCEVDWSNYRKSDIFDFKLEGEIYDVKTGIIYSNYGEKLKREPFSSSLLIKNRSYSGPIWRDFFPLMVAMTQLDFNREKKAYIYGLSLVENDPAIVKPYFGDGGFWCASPCEAAHPFYHSRILIRERESQTKGFSVILKWDKKQSALFDDLPGQASIKVTLYGEWASEKREIPIVLAPREEITVEQELSSLSCIRIEEPSALVGDDKLVVSARNNLQQPVAPPSDPSKNLNDPTKSKWSISRLDLINLRVPDNYSVFWLGYILIGEFAKKFLTYPSYFNPKKDNDRNEPGRLTPKLRVKLETLENRRTKALGDSKKVHWPNLTTLIKGNEIAGGVMISARVAGGQILGGACYYYPPYRLYESAFYVLPQDLNTMSSL